MKNEAKSENWKVDNGNNQQTKIEGRRSNLTVDQPNLKWKSNHTATPKRGFVRGIEASICKGPPGRSRSPGGSRDHPPEIKANPPNGPTVLAQGIPLTSRIEGLGVSSGQPITLNIQNQNTNTISNFYKHLNFLIMKKQIFILIMALFAIGVTNSYGQLLPHTVNCLPQDALHPVSGQDYTYQIDVPLTPSPGTAWVAGSLKYLWYVTQLDMATASTDKFFITAAGALALADDPGDGTGKFIATATGDYSATGTAAAGADNILKINWKNIVYDATKPIFVVIYTTGTTSASVPCDTENLKVFKIEPIIAFTIDIDNLTTTGLQHTAPVATSATDYGDIYSQCISDIASAEFDATAGKVKYDFGVNYLLYEVIAANWSTSWNLGVQLSGIGKWETRTVEWSKDRTFPGSVAIPTHAMTTTTTYVDSTTVLQYTSAVNVTPIATNTTGNIGSAGETIFIRVTLDHSVSGKPSYQGLNDEITKLAIDGMTNWDATATAFTIGDVHWNNATTSVGPPLVCAALATDAYNNDVAFQTIKARPTINADAATPAPGLVPVMIPNP